METRSTRYLVALTLMWGALSFQWTVLSNNLVPTRVLLFATEATKGRLLGLVTLVGASFYMLTGPIAGVLSDELRSRWGRRRPFLVVGMLANAGALLALISARTVATFVCAYAVVQSCMSLAGGPSTALIPDQVPDVQRGTATGFAGLAEVVGRLSGAIAGGLMISLPAAAGLGAVLVLLPQRVRLDPMLPLVLLLIGVTVGGMLVTVVAVREDVPAVRMRERQRHLIWHAFTFDVRAEANFAWLLIARGCRMLAIHTTVTFLLYYVRDYLGVSDLQQANAKLGYLFAVASLTTLPSAVIVGYLIDRYRHRRAWVAGASLGLAVVCLAFIFVRDFRQAIAIGALFGVGYGAYFTSDWALALNSLPTDDEAAKYLGIWVLAGTLPQVLAPGLGGVLLDSFNRMGPNWGYRAIFVANVLYLLVGTALLAKVAEPETGPPASVHQAANTGSAC